MSLSFKISKITGAPSFDSLPVAKITRYPLEERDYKPYAQCILCVNNEALILRMWSFEVSPLPASSLRCVLYLFRDKPRDALCVDIYSTGHVHASLLHGGQSAEDGTVLQKEEFTTRELGGEDLQGVYWGNTVTIPLDCLRRLGGALDLNPGGSFPGNFYKLCSQEPFVHSGSCFPADFAANPYARNSMGELQVVCY